MTNNKIFLMKSCSFPLSLSPKASTITEFPEASTSAPSTNSRRKKEPTEKTPNSKTLSSTIPSSIKTFKTLNIFSSHLSSTPLTLSNTLKNTSSSTNSWEPPMNSRLLLKPTQKTIKNSLSLHPNSALSSYSTWPQSLSPTFTLQKFQSPSPFVTLSSSPENHRE